MDCFSKKTETRVCLFTAGVLQHFVTFSGISGFRDLIIISKMSSAPHYSCFMGLTVAEKSFVE